MTRTEISTKIAQMQTKRTGATRQVRKTAQGWTHNGQVFYADRAGAETDLRFTLDWNKGR